MLTFVSLTETPETGIDYSRLVEAALLDVVRDVLRRVAGEGAPGDHHFFLTFATAAEGVELSPALRRRYPEEMTVVLQNQFWGLEVEEESFSVTLSFDRRRQRLTVPFAALRAFVDPSVGFGLRFGPEPEREPGVEVTPAGEVEGEPPSSGNVVSIDRFRKRPSPS